MYIDRWLGTYALSKCTGVLCSRTPYLGDCIPILLSIPIHAAHLDDGQLSICKVESGALRNQHYRTTKFGQDDGVSGKSQLFVYEYSVHETLWRVGDGKEGGVCFLGLQKPNYESAVLFSCCASPRFANSSWPFSRYRIQDNFSGPPNIFPAVVGVFCYTVSCIRESQNAVCKSSGILSCSLFLFFYLGFTSPIVLLSVVFITPGLDQRHKDSPRPGL